jgi:predicted dehydrogenase
MEKMRVGIVGAGLMADRMAATLVQMDTVDVRAVAARDEERARQFAAKHGIAKAYGSYAQLAEDPDVQLVYIATPNSHHREHCILCLEHGKHVLCEKPFTMDAAEAREVFAAAKEKHLVVAEAMWTRYMPFMKTLRKIVDDGTIGKVLFIDAGVGHDVQHMERLSAPALGGGALLDLGVYALNFAAAFIDESPSSIAASRTKYSTGVDAQNTVVLSYPSGAMATLSTSMIVRTPGQGAVYGDKGSIIVDNIIKPRTARRYSATLELIETLTAPDWISGLEYEVLAVADAIRGGLDECPAYPHKWTLDILGQMETAQAGW